MAPSLDDLDLDLLAGAAVVDADQRSPRAHGRFSMFDLRAGAIRALSRGGVVARRDALTATIDEISGRARQTCIRLLSDAGIPDHLKVFMATETVRLKMRVAARMEGLATSGRSLTPDELRRSAASADGLDRLDESQLAAAGAIAGTGGLVAITGPAGAGKTTMLRVAHAGTHPTAATDAGGRADPEGGIRRIARSRCRGDEPARAARRPRLPLAH
ncbi:hypothetical protein [Microbacterium sp.]|uniref:hypothetical protein n=1 Tax=Microbacterium sp. TaxID=51671 RepID=UPI003C1D2BD2